MSRNRARYAQNFLSSRALAWSLVRKSTISKDDIVLEIGPGEGVFTIPLSKIARRVIAVEIDGEIVRKLSGRLPPGRSNVEIIWDDFDRISLPLGPCKMFSNIPFNHTARILKKIYASPQISEVYLILQKEAAEKYSGSLRESEVSVLAKPYYHFETIHRFLREDFYPVPAVDAVMLRIFRKDPSLLDPAERRWYRHFVQYGFRSTKRNLRLAYKAVFTFPQWKRLSRDLRFNREATASELTFAQWLALFSYFMIGVSPDKRPRVSLDGTRFRDF